jgi:hypothetical protein
MGLFRRKGTKRREKATAEPQEQATTVELQEQAKTVTPVAVKPQADTPQADAARREVTAEARPVPDEPGWGRAIGQQIAKDREARGSQQ